MLERLLTFLHPKPRNTAPAKGAVAHWASTRFLQHRSPGPFQFEIIGRLHERALRVECATSSRPYILGLELRARLDLELPPAGHVVVLSRALLRTLQTQAKARDGAAHGRKRIDEKPEELRWLKLFEETRWAGPDEAFWGRYAVLSDASGLACRWIDDEARTYLMAGDSEAAAQVPLMVALMRGKCYLRLQINPHAEEADALLALELLEYLGERALALAARSAESGRGPVSNRG